MIRFSVVHGSIPGEGKIFLLKIICIDEIII